MEKKKVENGVYFALLLVMMLYVFFLALDSDKIQSTGDAVYRTHQEYLGSVELHANEYMVVVGQFSSDYEKRFARNLAASLGTIVKSEEDVSLRQNLILIGSPATNSLLDEFLSRSYTGKPMIIVANKNLLILFKNEEQSENLLTLLIGEERELASPEQITSLLWLIGGVLIVVAILFSVLEIHRHHSVSEAKEETDTHKLDMLESYIEKYEKEGHSAKQIKEWLVKYGYDKQLVADALKKAKNA